MTRAVFFDVDGVLVNGYHANPERSVRWNENLLADLGIDPERFNKEFIYDLFVKQVLVGRMGLVEALDRALPGLGFNGPSMKLVSYWLSHDSCLNEPMLDLVRKLKASDDVRLYLATNQEHIRAFWLWQDMGLGELFEDIFYAARIGAAKPTRPFFDGIMARIGLQGERPLFFDDSIKVIEGARDYGWEAVLFDDLADCAAHPWIAARLGVASSTTDGTLDSAHT